jgi:DNA polymerase-3 subunit delta
MIEAYLKAPRKELLLMCIGPVSASISKLIQEKGIVVDSSEEKPWDKQARLYREIKDACTQEGFHIREDALSFLAKEWSSDTSLMSSELEKAFVYLHGKREIELEDIKNICVFSPSTELCQLHDALMKRDSRKTVQVLHAMQSSDFHPLQVVRYLRNQFHIALELVSLHEEGISHQEMSACFQKMKGKQFEKKLKAGLRFLHKALVVLDQLEFDLKNAPFDEQMTLELALIYICRQTDDTLLTSKSSR